MSEEILPPSRPIVRTHSFQAISDGCAETRATGGSPLTVTQPLQDTLLTDHERTEMRRIQPVSYARVGAAAGRARLTRGALTAAVLAMGVLASLLQAAGTAVASPGAVTIIGETYTALSHSTLTSDGRILSELYATPTFSSAGGQWHRVRPTPHSVSSHLQAETVAGDVLFGAASGSLVTLAAPGGTLAVSIPGLDAPAPELLDGRVHYRDVAVGTDLVYEVTPSAVKDSIILRTADAPGSMTFAIGDPDGLLLDVKPMPGGGLELRNDGDWRVVVPPPTVRSGAGPDVFGHASYSWTRTAAGLSITVALDPTWRASAVYPITIDPTIAFTSADGQGMSKWGIWNDTNPSTLSDGAASYLPIGGLIACCPSHSVVGTRVWYRTLLRFDVAALPPGTAVQVSKAGSSVTILRWGHQRLRVGHRRATRRARQRRMDE
jgi:hypothetical protein